MDHMDKDQDQGSHQDGKAGERPYVEENEQEALHQ